MIDYVETKNNVAFWDAYTDPQTNYLVLEGGTSSSKTFSAVFCFVLLAQNVVQKSPYLISLVAESVPKLKLGMMRDFRIIMADSWSKKSWNATDRVYTLDNGNQLEFLNADDEERLKGPRREHILIDEANHVSYNVARQAFVRTRGFKVITHNPTAEYWAHNEIEPRKDCRWVHSTFMDALHVLDRAVVDEILSHKERDPNWWRVFGQGLIGNIEGLCHPAFTQIDALPDSGQVVYGLDFGYTNDPTALVKCVFNRDKISCHEVIYKRGLTNREIAAAMVRNGVRPGKDQIVADSAEPKSIRELCDEYGFNVVPCQKGRDSIKNGIQLLNTMQQEWTRESTNCIKEMRSYSYITDRDGNFTNVPVDDYNHAMDARRYAAMFYKSPNRITSARMR